MYLCLAYLFTCKSCSVMCSNPVACKGKPVWSFPELLQGSFGMCQLLHYADRLLQDAKEQRTFAGSHTSSDRDLILEEACGVGPEDCTLISYFAKSEQSFLGEPDFAVQDHWY